MSSIFLSFKLFKAVLFSNKLLHLEVLSIFVFLYLLLEQIGVGDYFLGIFSLFSWMLFFSLQIYIGKEILDAHNIEKFENRFAQVNFKNYLFDNFITVLTISLFSFVLAFAMSFILAVSFTLFYYSIVFYIIIAVLASYMFPIVCGRIFSTKGYKEVLKELVTIFKQDNITVAFSKNYFFMVLIIFLPLLVFELFVANFFMLQGNLLYEVGSLIGNYFLGILIVSILGSVSMFLAKNTDNNQKKLNDNPL